jgi:hypothetical protein
LFLSDKGYFRIWYWSSLLLSLTILFSLVFQRTCELGAQYVSLEKETNQLRVDLEVEKRNVACAQAELKTMGGRPQLPIVLLPLFFIL